MANILFNVGEPVEVVFDGNGKSKLITAQCKRDFLASDEFLPYSKKHGVYVFALRAGQGYTPWYVGKTNGKKGMFQECMTDNKICRYNEAMRKSNGTPVLFFIVRPGNNNYAPKPIVKDMEKQLTQDALAKNQHLLNTQNTRNIPMWSIKGVVRSNAGKPSKIELAFRKAMGV